MPRFKNRIGEKYGHWTIIAKDETMTQQTGRQYWLCECDCGCGTQKSIRLDALYQVKIGGCNNMVGPSSKKCEKCGKMFAPKKQANTRQYCYDCLPEENYDGTILRQKIKQWALDYKGNKCEICGYNKCTDALDFHHINPKIKKFKLSDRNIPTDWATVQLELDKCILVCANCHRELHSQKKEENI